MLTRDLNSTASFPPRWQAEQLARETRELYNKLHQVLPVAPDCFTGKEQSPKRDTYPFGDRVRFPRTMAFSHLVRSFGEFFRWFSEILVL